MGLSSLSPANSACLTTSLSRRLSMKNASAGVLYPPMSGANGGRKRSGSCHESKHVEPSSPKVTCIGQVRVKTRKHVKKTMRARSRTEGRQTSLRRSSSDQNDGGGRRFDGSENRWVHLPVTLCESLRALNCLFPCRSSCTDDTHHDRDRSGGGNSCVAVFTRWFVAVEETGGKRSEIELVVGGGGEEDRRKSCRRHVFENLDLSIIETTKTTLKEDVGAISMCCSPPKNALLLMRCRSDPVKVAALANRVRERQMSLNDVVFGREEEEKEEEEADKRRFELDSEAMKWISDKNIVETDIAVPVLSVEEKEAEADSVEEETEALIIKTIEDDIRKAIEEEVERSDQRNQEPDPSPEVGKEKTTPYKVLPDCLLLMMCEPKLSMEVSKETWVCSTDFVRCQPGRPPARKIPEAAGDHHHQSKKRMVTAVDSNVSSRRRSVDRPPVHQALLQPPRSSCSYPAAAPPAAGAVGEEKVAGANKAYEPPMLPRCKSEPRKSASKLAPETCFWKNRKLEPHSPATVGIGAAGVGF